MVKQQAAVKNTMHAKHEKDISERNDYLRSAQESLRQLTLEIRMELSRRNLKIVDDPVKSMSMAQSMTFQLLQDRLNDVAFIGCHTHRY